ncbi:MAG TPA: polyprenyl synthetase family protein, partial [Anaerolineae bacterium]|nr:polyprenyl synthetase family protein [Anaerolineae bacterium]
MSRVNQLLSLVADDMPYVDEKMRSGLPEKHQDLRAVVDYLVGAGGKRIRPALTIMAARMRPVEAEKLHGLAAAVELLHTASLVHDD